MICSVCRRVQLTEQPHDHTGWPGWDPDPLHVEPEPVEGWETARRRAVGRPVVDRGAIAWVTCAFLVLFAIVWFIAINLLSAPRSEPQPTDRFDVSPVASAVASSGAPSTAGAPATALGAPQAARIGTASGALKGVATYFPSCRFCAAASGELQDAIGPDWKGSFVTVTSGGHSVVVQLVTGCACGPRHGELTVIDLSEHAFSRLAPLSQGVVAVTVEWESGPRVTLPPTDLEEAP